MLEITTKLNNRKTRIGKMLVDPTWMNLPSEEYSAARNELTEILDYLKGQSLDLFGNFTLHQGPMLGELLVSQLAGVRRFYYETLVEDIDSVVDMLKTISTDSVKNNLAKNISTKTQKPIAETSQSFEASTNLPLPNNKKVFVVHGRDEKLRSAMFDFLRSIGLEPLEWDELIRETGEGTPYIGSILDQAFSKAQAIVVLMSPDDIARLRRTLLNPNDPPQEREFMGQARQNVTFEAGMAFGHNPNRTILIEVGGIRSYSDISGRHVVKLYNSPIQRKALAERLKTAGCDVNTDGSDWLEKGDFSTNHLSSIDEEFQSNNQTCKYANLWWLCRDLYAAIQWIANPNSTKRQIDHGLLKCFHHATELGLEQSIIARLQRYKDNAHNMSLNEWTSEERRNYQEALVSIMNDIGAEVQKNQPDFDSGPDLI